MEAKYKALSVSSLGFGEQGVQSCLFILPPFPASEPSRPRCVPWCFWGHFVDPKPPQNTKQMTLSWFGLPVSRDEKTGSEGKPQASSHKWENWGQLQPRLCSVLFLGHPLRSLRHPGVCLRVAESNNHVQTHWWFRQVICLLSAYFLKLLLIERELLYSILLVSVMHQHEWAIGIHMSPSSWPYPFCLNAEVFMMAFPKSSRCGIWKECFSFAMDHSRGCHFSLACYMLFSVINDGTFAQREDDRFNVVEVIQANCWWETEKQKLLGTWN